MPLSFVKCFRGFLYFLPWPRLTFILVDGLFICYSIFNHYAWLLAFILSAEALFYVSVGRGISEAFCAGKVVVFD